MFATTRQIIGVAVAGSLIGLMVNAARTDRQIVLTRDYFKVLNITRSNDAGRIPVSDGTGPGAPPATNLEHPFTPVTLDEVIDLFQSPGFGTGEIVFIDARNDEHYEEGHIPGAIHIDRYNSDEHFDQAKVALRSADIIVIYCGGGECEDSIYLASELVEPRGIPFENIRLFEGGMMEWEGDNLDLEVGDGTDGISEIGDYEDEDEDESE